MSTSDWIAIGGIIIGLYITTIGGIWHLSSKIGALGERIARLETRVSGLEEKVSILEKILDTAVNAITQLRIEMTEIQVKLDILWRHHTALSKSPLSLNEEGLRALETSKIGSFAEQHYAEILSRVKALKPENAFQAQEILISVVGRYKKVDEYRLHLQEAAFISGQDIDSLLFVAALSIRDRVVSELGFDR